LVVLALLFFGGPTLYGFSLSLSIGIVIGTYSSIYVAGALAVVMGLSRHHLMPAPKLTNKNQV
jgi:preprotein translocase subunit SecF